MTYQPFGRLRVDAEFLPKHRKPRFKFVDRGFKKGILLIPGWATDCRIFEKLDIPFNYLFLENAPPGEFAEIFTSLPRKIKLSVSRILGWSMGGFIAADLISRYPAIFNEVIFVSIRRSYDKNGIGHIKNYLKRNSKAYLCRFYDGLFSKSEKEHKRWFKEGLLKEYLQDPDSLHLFDGLNYLANRKLKADSLNCSNIIFVHGEDDTIAPLEEARIVADELPFAKFISIKGASHFPILKEEFRGIFMVKESINS
ncbi:MAG: alpha/beta hydrolase [Candidatus Omnitrophota bacterium]